MVRFRVMVVGLTYETLFTVTPSPFTVADSRFGKPWPGSKNPELLTDDPVMVTSTVVLAFTVAGAADDSIAGGGALRWVTRMPHESSATVFSWNVQNVILSVGSTTVLL